MHANDMPKAVVSQFKLHHYRKLVALIPKQKRWLWIVFWTALAIVAALMWPWVWTWW
jgi:hypothetical protein